MAVRDRSDARNPITSNFMLDAAASQLGMHWNVGEAHGSYYSRL